MRISTAKLLLPLLLLFAPLANASIYFNGNPNYRTDLNPATGNVVSYLQSQAFTISFNNTTQLSYAFWVYVPDNLYAYYTLGTTLGGKQNTSTPNNAFYISFDGCPLAFPVTNNLCPAIGIDETNGNYYFIQLNNSNVVLRGRHLVVLTWKQNSGTLADFKFYIDDQLQTGTVSGQQGESYSSGVSLQDGNYPLTVGATTGINPPDSPASGYFGDYEVWNYQLTQTDVNTLWNNGIPQPCKRIGASVEPTYIIYYFPFDDYSSGTVSTAPIEAAGFATGINLATTIRGSPTWSSKLECSQSTLNNIKLNNAKVNGGTQ